jgi:glycosyltransferase involved in cell wall biosynthesis
MTVMPDARSTLKILSIVEATTVNAVAKIVLEFYRAARELNQTASEFPSVEGCAVTFDRRRGFNGPPNDFVIAAAKLGLDVELIPERRRFDLSVIPALRSVIESREPDLVVTNSVKSHFLLWRSRLWRKYPWVAFHHGYTSTDRKMSVYNRLDRWSLPKADRLVTVCRAFARELAYTTGVSIENISVLHNAIRRPQPVSAADTESLRERLGIAGFERAVLSVGRLSREKAHIDLLEAFKRMSELKPEVSPKLIIVGDGPERARLETAVKSLGCKERVIFAGQVSDVRTFYDTADVFVLTSHSEGSPNVLLEAMAANLPIVATAVGGVPEMVENNVSALVVPPNDPPSIAGAIARLLTDKELAQRLTTNAAKLVDTRYTPENYVRSVVEIYREVLAARQNTR